MVNMRKPITVAACAASLFLGVFVAGGAKYANWQAMDKAGIKISTSLGSNVDLYAPKVFQKAEITRVKDGSISLTQLLTGRVDAWANSFDAFQKISVEQPELAVVPNSGFAGSKVVFMVRRGDYVFRDWFNAFIDEYRSSGELLRTLKKYGLDESYMVY